jgi:hypothetical protein
MTGKIFVLIDHQVDEEKSSLFQLIPYLIQEKSSWILINSLL